MKTHRKVHIRKHTKGQEDHVDAWLMSYADMITLLFMLFAISVTFAISKKHSESDLSTAGEPEHPIYQSNHTGLLTLETDSDEAFRLLTGVVIDYNMDQNIAVERKKNGVWVELSSPVFFDAGSANIREDQVALLQSIARSIIKGAPVEAELHIETYTDDVLPPKSTFADNWELSAMQAAHISAFLEKEGIPASRITAIGNAGSKPQVPNQDAAGKPIPKNHLHNQRVLIKILIPENNAATIKAPLIP